VGKLLENKMLICLGPHLHWNMPLFTFKQILYFIGPLKRRRRTYMIIMFSETKRFQKQNLVLKFTPQSHQTKFQTHKQPPIFLVIPYFKSTVSQ